MSDSDADIAADAEPILDELMAFASDSGLSLSYICKMAVNNSDLAKRIEAGKTLTTRTERILQKWLRDERVRRNLPAAAAPPRAHRESVASPE